MKTRDDFVTEKAFNLYAQGYADCLQDMITKVLK